MGPPNLTRFALYSIHFLQLSFLILEKWPFLRASLSLKTFNKGSKSGVNMGKAFTFDNSVDFYSASKQVFRSPAHLVSFVKNLFNLILLYLPFSQKWIKIRSHSQKHHHHPNIHKPSPPTPHHSTSYRHDFKVWINRKTQFFWFCTTLSLSLSLCHILSLLVWVILTDWAVHELHVASLRRRKQSLR